VGLGKHSAVPSLGTLFVHHPWGGGLYSSRVCFVLFCFSLYRGRKLTPQGQRDLDRIAGQVRGARYASVETERGGGGREATPGRG
jgi:hypothetical protein